MQTFLKKNYTKVHFCAGVPAYACIRAGAAALKSHCASNIFLRNGVPDKTCTCNVLVGRSEGRRRFYAATRHPLRPPCRTRSPAFPHCSFGGWRSQLTFGFERKWQRGASPRHRYRGVPKLRIFRILQINFYFLRHFRKKVQKDLQISFFFCIFAR